MSHDVLLTIDGAVEQPLRLTVADLDAVPESARLRDVSRFDPKRQGEGVALVALLEQAGVRPEATYLTLHADRDDFHVSVPLQAVREQGVIVYRLGGDLLSAERGGPLRFLIPDPSACHAGELDECANVKYLTRIELSVGRGRDTRPTTESDHAALHEAQAPSTPADRL
jgi:DMSO/TMAO reductase YedYZ molybdopterin-dependent catalytic subunit